MPKELRRAESAEKATIESHQVGFIFAVKILLNGVYRPQCHREDVVVIHATTGIV